MKKVMSIAMVALMGIGSVAYACDGCGCSAKKAEGKKECSASKTGEEKKACAASKTAEEKKECGAAKECTK